MVFEFVTNNISFFLFILFIVVFVWYKRENLDIQGKFPQFFVLMYKTKLGLDKMQRWSKNRPGIFHFLGIVSLIIGVFGLVFSLLVMGFQIWLVHDLEITSGAAGFVLPIKTEKGVEGAIPVFHVPFAYWIISIFVLVVVHEFAHGVIAKRYGIKVKSSGFAFFGSAIVVIVIAFFSITTSYGWFDVYTLNPDLIFALILAAMFMFIPFMPAAFVEPDDRQMAKKKPWQQIAVLGAGSTSNFIFGFLVFLPILLFLVVPFYANTVEITEFSFSSVMQESDLNGYGIESGKVLAVNDEENVSRFLDLVATSDIGDKLNLTIDSMGVIGTYQVTTFENPSMEDRPMLGISGISFGQTTKEGYEWLGSFPLQLKTLFEWLVILNIGIGLVNLLPLWITDGGQVLRVIMQKYYPNKPIVMRTVNFFSLISLIMIILLLFPKLIFKVAGFF